MVASGRETGQQPGTSAHQWTHSCHWRARGPRLTWLHPGSGAVKEADIAEPTPHESNDEDEVDPLTEEEATAARMDLLSAYTLHGRLDLDGLLHTSLGARAEEAAPVVEPPAPGDDGYYYKEPGEKAWTAA